MKYTVALVGVLAFANAVAIEERAPEPVAEAVAEADPGFTLPSFALPSFALPTISLPAFSLPGFPPPKTTLKTTTKPPTTTAKPTTTVKPPISTAPTTKSTFKPTGTAPIGTGTAPIGTGTKPVGTGTSVPRVRSKRQLEALKAYQNKARAAFPVDLFAAQQAAPQANQAFAA